MKALSQIGIGMDINKLKAMVANAQAARDMRIREVTTKIRDNVRLLHGDCLELLSIISTNSVDSIVTDPPYGLSFMGNHWDHGCPDKTFWLEMFRCLKPGGHLLAFGGTRTHHRLVCHIEDAGFEIRDEIQWLYGTGFPKSLNISKAIDKANGEVRPQVPATGGLAKNSRLNDDGWRKIGDASATMDSNIPISKEAIEWDGWGTALKPGFEPICMARKPLEGSVVENVLKWGVGGINIDACRLLSVPPSVPQPSFNSPTGNVYNFKTGYGRNGQMSESSGRWPSNVILSHSIECQFMGTKRVRDASGWSKTGSNESENFAMSGKNYARNPRPDTHTDEDGFSLIDVYECVEGCPIRRLDEQHIDAAKFFYVAKASKSERNGDDLVINNHPTVKPVSLMRYLCKLVTPSNGIVLDSFMGSGSTGVGAVLEGFGFIGIEQEREYFEIAKTRMSKVLDQACNNARAQL